MHSNSHHPAHSAIDQNYSEDRKFFIPRSQCRRLLIQFTLMTLLGWVVGGVASLGLENALTYLDLSFGKSLNSFLCNVVFAVIFAADQALVLRPYLSTRRWILATAAGWLIANGVSTAWIKYILAIASSLHVTSSPEVIVILGFLSTVSYILSGIFLGFCQWLVLRKYTTGTWWWNFIPVISFFFISLLIWLLSLLQDFLPVANRTSILYWSEQCLTPVILGVVPAISLCTLKKNYLPKLKFFNHFK
ncbi:hypothetical protein [Fortiea contorta]|uniref:hypothetical protein n=1 Tax=Fortiea contorta TaxID=1892405 RepID=UPI000345BE7D|nr:hypothetical protein [Fortiea contorta]